MTLSSRQLSLTSLYSGKLRVASPLREIPNKSMGQGVMRGPRYIQNPADSELEVVTRTVGPDHVIDVFVIVCHFTHDQTVDWLLHGVPATGKKLSIPIIAVVNVRGDCLYNEHIWWDQATVLRQAGILPTHVPFPLPTDGAAPSASGKSHLRLSVAGAESTAMLVNESKGKSNKMFGPKWGLQANPKH